MQSSDAKLSIKALLKATDVRRIACFRADISKRNAKLKLDAAPHEKQSAAGRFAAPSRPSEWVSVCLVSSAKCVSVA